MRQQRSPRTKRRYPLTMICQVDRLARSTVYATAVSAAKAAVPQTRGPKAAWSDAVLLEAIHGVLATCPVYGEGYRKVRARLAHRGIHVSSKRVLRLMRAHGLLAPRRLGPPHGNPAHDGQIIIDRPDVMWGTDATRFFTVQDGWCWFFGAVDHHTDEAWAGIPRSGVIAGQPCSRFAKGIRVAFGHVTKEGARGLRVRCDGGPQYVATAWIQEVKWLGMAISPSYVGEPQCHGVAERFMRTLKEQCLYRYQFETLEQAQQMISEFIMAH